jgi:hypothetical protein
MVRNDEGTFEEHNRTGGYRRVNAAVHLLGITAYAVPWLLSLSGRARTEAAGAVLVLGLLFAVWTARSRRPTIVSVIGSIFIAAAIGLGPTLRAAGWHYQSLLPVTPQTAMMFVLAVAFGIAIARPSVRGSRYINRPSYAAADRSGARAGAWLVLVATPPLAYATYRMQRAPNLAEAAFGLAMAGAIVVFGVVVSMVGASRARSRRDWLEQVRRGEVPGFRIRPRTPSDPKLVAFDDVASSRSSAVLEACISPNGSSHRRAVALAPLE